MTLTLDFPYATSSRLSRIDSNLLLIDNSIHHFRMLDLASLLDPGSILVVNDAATLPASLYGMTVDGNPIEMRLVSNINRSQKNISHWKVILYLGGSWRIKTEDRIPYIPIEGEILNFGDLKAQIRSINKSYTNFAEIKFLNETNNLWQELYKQGKPIQYSHLTDDLELLDVQTPFAVNPVAIEPPSASFQFTWDLLDELKEMGIEIVNITHATSISSTGNEELDKLLPFPEHYWISTQAAKTLNEALRESKPIVGIGTSVTRALESNMKEFGLIKAGAFTTDLVIDENHKRLVIRDLFTGMHLPTESHIKLLSNFVPEDLLDTAYQDAVKKGYLWHEYGDVSLIKSRLNL